MYLIVVVFEHVFYLGFLDLFDLPLLLKWPGVGQDFIVKGRAQGGVRVGERIVVRFLVAGGVLREAWG